MDRIRYFFNAWYQPNVRMHREDWLYIACLLVGSNIAFGVGLLIGIVISW